MIVATVSPLFISIAETVPSVSLEIKPVLPSLVIAAP